MLRAAVLWWREKGIIAFAPLGRIVWADLASNTSVSLVIHVVRYSFTRLFISMGIMEVAEREQSTATG